MLLQIIVPTYSGVVEDVELFKTEKEALEWLSEETGEEFDTVEEFAAWQNENADANTQYSWFEREVS